ncbi:hypothetical protein BKP56_05390 [Marinilactibacillus sp. 15R]|uniref:hypothetical protein n=1 Tax=Marinilactibacillus sp. 15R TaxID=1911586 RepID=UPI000909AA52|nr:hypothetical protein [Marinilactibacillus sp. 15R]API88755.1 hypothetical protein BKP56_05390 [Marinilactibacillus sp. 15R]
MEDLFFTFMPILMIVLYLAVPAAVSIFFLKLCYDMVNLTKEKNNKLERLVRLLEERKQENK